jgi:hypothetical protein
MDVSLLGCGRGEVGIAERNVGIVDKLDVGGGDATLV